MRAVRALVCCLALAGCQTVDAAPAVPAVADLSTSDAVARAQIVLAQALGRGRVELGPHDGARAATLSVLPPPPGARETHYMAIPILFDVVLRDGKCHVIRRDTKQVYDLHGIACRPA